VKNTSFWVVFQVQKQYDLAEDAEHLEHILTSKTGESAEQVKEVLLKNRRMTLHEVANMFGISFVSVRRILEGNLYVLPVATKFVPCLLSEEQKENCVSTQQDLQERLQRDSEPVAKIITADPTQGGIRGKEIL